MKPIAIFYHGLFIMGQPPHFLPSATPIICKQMSQLTTSGLLEAASEFHVGINGGPESKSFVNNYIPKKAGVIYHGLSSRAENLTIVGLENWVKSHPGWNVLYFHSKGASHPLTSDYGKSSGLWRDGMMEDLVMNWRQCVADLETHDIVASHWMWELGHDKSQHIPCGNFLWLSSDFAAKLPSIYLRERIKQDGIAALSSRYEAEVYWGNGPKPIVKQFRPNGGGGVP